VRPLTRHLATLDAWITGLRRDQWASRTNIRKVELDHDHGGIVKLNPLAEWTEDEVWDYVREREIPYNVLYDRGYTSIGCAPCSGRRMSEGTIRGEAAEVARAETQAVLSMLQDETRRARLADLLAALGDGAVEGEDADVLGELLELGLRTGRLRAVYGPGGEQAARTLYRRLPAGKELTQSTSDLNAALEALEGRALDKVRLTAVGPGEY